MNAYLRRDWLVWASYRLNAFWQFVGVFILVVGVVMVGNSLGTRSDLLGGSKDYASFVFAGLAFTDVLFSGLTGPPRALRDGQTSGTLEPVLLTPIRTWQLLTASTAFFVFLAFVRAALLRHRGRGGVARLLAQRQCARRLARVHSGLPDLSRARPHGRRVRDGDQAGRPDRGRATSRCRACSGERSSPSRRCRRGCRTSRSCCRSRTRSTGFGSHSTARASRASPRRSRS